MILEIETEDFDNYVIDKLDLVSDEFDYFYRLHYIINNSDKDKVINQTMEQCQCELKKIIEKIKDDIKKELNREI